VQHAPSFCEVWGEVQGLLAGAHFLVSHNAAFDSRVLATGCSQAAIKPPSLPHLCTVRLSRRVLRARPARLASVCATLGIPLRHHDPLSDAEACARIMLAVQEKIRACGRLGATCRRMIWRDGEERRACGGRATPGAGHVTDGAGASCLRRGGETLAP